MDFKSPIRLISEKDQKRFNDALRDIQTSLNDCKGKDAHRKVISLVGEIKAFADEDTVAAKYYAAKMKLMLREWSSEKGILCLLMSLEK